MKIINKTKGPIYYNTSFPGYADCGKIEMNDDIYLGYPDIEGSASITLLKDDNANVSEGNYQSFPVKGSSNVVVSISVD